MYHSGIQKVGKAAEAFHPFTYHEWVFEQNNMRKLHHLLAPEERETFLLKTEDLDWRSWTHYFFYGIARWLLNEQSGRLRETSDCEPEVLAACSIPSITCTNESQVDSRHPHNVTARRDSIVQVRRPTRLVSAAPG